MDKKVAISYIDSISTGVISLVVLLLPVFFLTNTTDFFILPKQILVVFVTLLLLVLWVIKVLLEKKIVVLSNPLNLPVSLFAIAVITSSFLSVNRFDALLQAVPLLASIILFFAIVNNIKNKLSFNILEASLIIGASLASILSILYYFKIYFLPIPEIQSQAFTPLGSSVQHGLYILPMLVLALSFILKKLGFPRLKLNSETLKFDQMFLFYLLSSFVLLAGVALIIFQIITLPDKPVILPYIYGFQTAFAEMSQDSSRFILSFLFGSGYGTFLTDFTRFRLQSFNLEPNIWNLNFSFSSSYFLELIATMGLSGIITYLFIIVTMIKDRANYKNPLFKTALLILALSMILPFSYTTITLLFIVLGIYVSYLRIKEDKRVDEVVLSLVALRRGLFVFSEEEKQKKNEETIILSLIMALAILAVVGYVGLFAIKFVGSDIKFAESLRQSNLNNGRKTYDLQSAAITEFPYRSDYYRIFSQINLALASNLVASVPQGTKPSDDVQRTILQLLQNSISSARSAVTISPLTSQNWQNLGQIYRNLINVGQNAEQFAIASLNQAIALDQYNPQLFILLGGIYYQLGQFDLAQAQFQTAINLKRDFANAYYNLGHTLEQKGDLQNAFQAYQIVQQLIKDDKANLDIINADIAALQKKAKDLEESQKSAQIQSGENQPPLGISEPSAGIPPQEPPIKISPPPQASVERPTPSVTPSVTTAPTPTP